jgi:alpha-mannosidase
MNVHRDRSTWLAVWLLIAGVAPAVAADSPPPVPARFTPLEPVASPKIIAHAENYPGGNFDVERIVDGQTATEYSSNGKGLDTFITFDFGQPVALAALEHLDRRDPATVSESKLVFANTDDMAQPLGEATLRHANTRGGRTMSAWPAPITARYVRWQVTGLGPQAYGTVGGAELKFYAALPAESTLQRGRIEVRGQPAVLRQQGQPVRIAQVKIVHPYAEPADAVLTVTGLPPQPVRLAFGEQTVDVPLPASEDSLPLTAAVELGGRVLLSARLELPPVRPWTIHLLSHSHVDIGYTNVQTEIEKLHWRFTDEALDLIDRTAGYPPEAQFRWNSEVLWAIDSYLGQATPQRREQFVRAVKSGRLHLDGLYGNELTGLCRPEELFRLLGCARRLSRDLGVPIDSAMISDVPGWTWGLVPALAHSGIQYFSLGTNHIHRIGNTLTAWGDKPFYWVSPSGQEKVLCWVAGKGYSWFHLNGRFEKVPPQAFFDYLVQLEADGCPYDMLPLRYSIDGDNGPPDARLPDLVRSWNEKYVWPKMALATTGETFREFERRWGHTLPEVRGDFTPYWEDGAGSSARETAQTRNAAELLTQAETLWSLRDRPAYPAADFERAWRNVLLYNEHTWGAHCSISQPDSDFTKAQWQIKQRFALDALDQARDLLGRAAAAADADRLPAAVDVWNTHSWPRTDLVALAGAGFQQAALAVFDTQGQEVPAQRLSDGTWVFLARDVPPLGAKRFLVRAAASRAAGNCRAEGLTLTNGRLRVAVDPRTGAIASLTLAGLPGDLVAAEGELGLNDYRYVAGRQPASAAPAAPPTIRVLDAGPLVASLAVEGAAPGCRKLTRELRVIDGLDRVDVVNVLDREQVRTPEGVHLGFAVNVPDGVVRMDVPWAVIRPEADQLPGACRNYFSVGRWLDVSNAGAGLTCVTLDCPLAELGQIRMDVSSPFDPQAWVSRLEPTSTFYWYLMNNYWETNYKADQEGVTAFRFALVPHGPFDQLAAMRAGLEQSQPLLAVPAAADSPVPPPILAVEPAEVLVTSLKPSDDGRAWIVRLWNASQEPAQVRLTWPGADPRGIVLSSPFEEERGELPEQLALPPFGIVTLRTAAP